MDKDFIDDCIREFGSLSQREFDILMRGVEIGHATAKFTVLNVLDGIIDDQMHYKLSEDADAA